MMKHPLTAREAAWTAFTPLELATQLRGEEEKRRIPITGLGSGTVGGGSQAPCTASLDDRIDSIVYVKLGNFHF